MLISYLISGSAQFVTTWQEDGLQRYRFTFQDVSLDNYGQDFLYAIRNFGGVSSNWQCWFDPVNGWTFDDSEVIGCAGATVIDNAVQSVTGMDATQTGFESVFIDLECSDL